MRRGQGQGRRCHGTCRPERAQAPPWQPLSRWTLRPRGTPLWSWPAASPPCTCLSKLCWNCITHLLRPHVLSSQKFTCRDEAVAVCRSQEQHVGAQRQGKLCCGCRGSGQAFFPIAATPAGPAAPSSREPALRAGGWIRSASAVRPDITRLCLDNKSRNLNSNIPLAQD